MAKRKTGMGTDIFYQDTKTAKAAPEPPGEEPQPAAPPKKVRTTVTLYPETLARMEALKIHARRLGHKATFSDILGQAIDDLARKWKVEA